MMWLVTSMVGLVPRVKLATPRRNVAATARHFTDSLFDNWWGGLCEFKVPLTFARVTMWRMQSQAPSR